MTGDNVVPIRPEPAVVELTVRPEPNLRHPDAYTARCPTHGLVERVPIGRSAKRARAAALDAAAEHGRARHRGDWTVR